MRTTTPTTTDILVGFDILADAVVVDVQATIPCGGEHDPFWRFFYAPLHVPCDDGPDEDEEEEDLDAAFADVSLDDDEEDDDDEQQP